MLGYTTLVSAFTSSIFSAATVAVAEQFDVSDEVGILGLSLVMILSLNPFLINRMLIVSSTFSDLQLAPWLGRRYPNFVEDGYPLYFPCLDSQYSRLG